jgi:hypothetical protein
MAEPVISGGTVITVKDQLLATWYAVSPLSMLIFFGVLAALLVPLAYSGEIIGALVILGLAILASIVFYVAAICLGFRRLSEDQRRIAYRIDGDGFTIKDATGTMASHPWSGMTKISEHDYGFSFRLKPYGARWLPKRALTDQDLAAFRTLAKAKLQDAAKLSA